MLDAQKEQASEILINEAINNDVLINKNNESKTAILFPELEIAPLKLNTKSMYAKHEKPTSKNNDYANNLDGEDIDALNYWNDLSNEISEFRHNLRGWPVTGGKGYHYINLPDLLAKLDMAEEEAYDIMQVYEIRDARGKWADDILKYGLLLAHEYV